MEAGWQKGFFWAPRVRTPPRRRCVTRITAGRRGRYGLRPSRIEVPVLILVGSEDRLTSRRSNERTSSMIPGSRLKVYPERGHDTMLECPEEVNRDLEAFLRECFA